MDCGDEFARFTEAREPQGNSAEYSGTGADFTAYKILPGLNFNKNITKEISHQRTTCRLWNTAVQWKYNVIHICNIKYPVDHIRKSKRGEMNCLSKFYLTLYIQNIISM